MSSRVYEIKHNPKEVDAMCELIEEYAEKRASEAAIQSTIKTARKCGAADNVIAKILKDEYKLDDVQIEIYLSRV